MSAAALRPNVIDGRHPALSFTIADFTCAPDAA